MRFSRGVGCRKIRIHGQAIPALAGGENRATSLYPTRRRYKGRWENCRLATIERQVLGVVREDDLPGSEAPAAWLSFLRGGSARNLRRVADHNRQDLASLGGLLVHHANLDSL
jgi:uncharacterized protein